MTKENQNERKARKKGKDTKVMEKKKNVIRKKLAGVTQMQGKDSPQHPSSSKPPYSKASGDRLSLFTHLPACK